MFEAMNGSYVEAAWGFGSVHACRHYKAKTENKNRVDTGTMGTAAFGTRKQRRRAITSA